MVTPSTRRLAGFPRRWRMSLQGATTSRGSRNQERAMNHSTRLATLPDSGPLVASQKPAVQRRQLPSAPARPTEEVRMSHRVLALTILLLAGRFCVPTSARTRARQLAVRAGDPARARAGCPKADAITARHPAGPRARPRGGVARRRRLGTGGGPDRPSGGHVPARRRTAAAGGRRDARLLRRGGDRGRGAALGASADGRTLATGSGRSATCTGATSCERSSRTASRRASTRRGCWVIRPTVAGARGKRRRRRKRWRRSRDAWRR